jgi:hypothetical protein
MPVSWDDRKRLLRLHGIADELLASARAAQDPEAGNAIGRQLDALTSEVHEVLAANDEALADEFTRVVMADTAVSSPAPLRAAMLVGWLKAGLAAEAMGAPPEPAKRKQTIGFKIRSPITREHESPGKGAGT